MKRREVDREGNKNRKKRKR